MNSRPRPRQNGSAWKLHDIEDVPAFIRDRLERLPAYHTLCREDQEDAIGGMVEKVLRIEAKWKPDVASFSTFIGSAIPNAFIDHLRKFHRDDRNPHERDADVFLTSDDRWFDGEYEDGEDEDAPDEHELLDGIDLEALSEAARDTLFKYAIPIRRGVSLESLSGLHNVTGFWVTKRLTQLAEELGALDAV
jgi:DNA-directed RNA polymerase specialized sigma24 family protein